ncbi:UNVERIFIED_CONTAM: hypothetical protein N8J90_00735 [Halobacillus marinus]
MSFARTFSYLFCFLVLWSLLSIYDYMAGDSILWEENVKASIVVIVFYSLLYHLLQTLKRSKTGGERL